MERSKPARIPYNMLSSIMLTVLVQQNSHLMGSMFDVGARVPNFTALDVRGDEFDLYNSIKDKKATVINFWTYG